VSDGKLSVQTDGLRSLSRIHDEVVAALSQLTGSAAPAAAGVQTTHGPIAMAVSAALNDVLATRQGTFQTTATSGTTISDLLRKAARLYDQGDRQGADMLRKAAERLGGDPAAGDPSGGHGTSPGAAGTSGGGSGTAGAGNPASAAIGAVSQALGQVGQLGQLGQQGQQATGPAQGLAQPLQQLPQQIMHGVHQIVEKATEAGQPTAGDPGEPAH